MPFLSANYDSSSSVAEEDAISSTTSSETDVATETTTASNADETFLGQVETAGKTVDGFLVSSSYSTSIPRVIFPSDPILKGKETSSAWPRVKSTERNFVVLPSWFRALKQKYESKRQQKRNELE